MSKPQHVYIMEANGLFKVGVSVDPKKREAMLQCGNPDIRLLFVSRAISNGFKVEHRIHKSLQDYQYGREWFSGISSEELQTIVEEAVEKYGLDPGSMVQEDPYGKTCSVQFVDGKCLKFGSMFDALAACGMAETFTSCEAKQILENAGYTVLPDNAEVTGLVVERRAWPSRN